MFVDKKDGLHYGIFKQSRVYHWAGCGIMQVFVASPASHQVGVGHQIGVEAGSSTSKQKCVGIHLMVEERGFF